MATFCCVNAGNYCGQGAKYVNILFDSVRRNLAEGFPGRFIVFTDDPAGLDEGIVVRPLPHEGLGGWFNKLALFKPGLFVPGEQVIYLDLDLVITGRLDEFTAYRSDFLALRDLGTAEGVPKLSSSIMSWRADGPASQIWKAYSTQGHPLREHDGFWIGEFCPSVEYLQDQFPSLVVSYKYSGTGIPKEASIVDFHGHPCPHEVLEGWVPRVWCVGGLLRAELDVICNTYNAQILGNIRHACSLDLPWFDLRPAHGGSVMICGGGPSLKDKLTALRHAPVIGSQVWALNGAGAYLANAGIQPDAVFILDARPENAAFVQDGPKSSRYYLASQCDKVTFDAAEGREVVLYHNATEAAQELLESLTIDKPTHLLGGGSTVGLKALIAAYLLGYRSIHLYGMDSCYFGDAHHAYRQDLNSGETLLCTEVGGRQFMCAPWMVTQATEFIGLATDLIDNGCVISVGGDGLLAHIAREMMKPVEVVEEHFRRAGEWFTPVDDRGSAEEIDAGSDAHIEIALGHCRGREVAIQAGGHIGIYPLKLARHFTKVFSIEPAPNLARAFRRNQENQENQGFGHRVTLREAALSDHSDYVALVGEYGRQQVTEGSQIPTVTIDNLVWEYEISACDLIYLDIEGYEYKALKGAVHTIRRYQPTIIIEEKGLSQRYGIRKGDTTQWLIDEFDYQVSGHIGRDVILTPKDPR